MNPIPLTSDSGHIKSKFTLSPPAEDLLDPTLTGDRQLPSPLDLALLAGIGYQVTTSYLGQQFQIQNLIALKALHQENFTILDNLGDRWNGVKSKIVLNLKLLRWQRVRRQLI